MSLDTSSTPVRQAAETWESLFRTQVGVMRRLQKDPAFKELSMREYDVLFNLTRCPTGWIRLNELNVHLLISQPSLSRMVERMESKGLVQRRPAENDQRGVEVSLTEEGLALQRKLGSAHVRGIYELLTPALSETEMQELKSLTDKVLASLPANDG